MKEVIEDILKVEEEGRKRVEEARKKAKEIVLAATEEGEKRIHAARAEAEKEALHLLTEAERQAHQEREAILSASGTDVESLWQEKGGQIEAMIQFFYEAILKGGVS